MDDYELKVEENKKRNKKFLKEFEDYLKASNLSNKVINKHLSNVNFYLNDFLTYYDVIKMEDGAREISSFLGDWFIRKVMWASISSIKENAASIKKFYKCMLEHKYIEKDDYDSLCSEIKDEMDEWLERLKRFDNLDDFTVDWF